MPSAYLLISVSTETVSVSCRSYVTQLLYSVQVEGLMLSPDTDDPPDADSLTSSIESAVEDVSMFRGEDIVREDNMYSLTLVGVVQSRQSLTNALTSGWQMSYSMLLTIFLFLCLRPPIGVSEVLCFRVVSACVHASVRASRSPGVNAISTIS